jgi:hypothetical protein
MERLLSRSRTRNPGNYGAAPARLVCALGGLIADVKSDLIRTVFVEAPKIREGAAHPGSAAGCSLTLSIAQSETSSVISRLGGELELELRRCRSTGPLREDQHIRSDPRCGHNRAASRCRAGIGHCPLELPASAACLPGGGCRQSRCRPDPCP